MNRIIWRLILLLTCLFSNMLLFAQDNQKIEDIMRSNGKIYVVVAVCITILTGLFVYVFIIDRKISKLEKEN